MDQREWVRVSVPRSPWVFAMASGDRMTTIQKGFRAACVRAGIDDFREHGLRHTFASWLVMAGVSLYVVKDLLEHASVMVTERYAYLAPHMGREAVRTTGWGFTSNKGGGMLLTVARCIIDRAVIY
ncbi:tyrosine-type recombinase/integrase [Burkholderia ubonensis]|nr:tyrosine-type recombinase/integrase [Burkholderia ubonensis]